MQVQKTKINRQNVCVLEKISSKGINILQEMCK